MSDFLYRKVLYSRYTEAFGARKTPDLAGHSASFQALHSRRLPTDKEAAIADLGCGRGEWITWLGQRGYTRLSGVDLSVSDLEFATAVHPAASWVHDNALEWLTKQNQTWDLIHAKDLVEHLTKDEFIQFLQSAQRALKPGGRLFLLTFNAQSPLSTATRYGDFTHETGHTPSSMAQCLRACGFQTVKVEGVHYCPATRSGRLRSLLGRVLYAAAQVVLAIRHGKGVHEAGVEHLTTLPDLFVEATA